MNIFLKFFFVISGLFILFILIASPVTKYIIQKYDYSFTGREITLASALVNPLGGSATLKDINIYEYESDTVFFSARKISTDLSLLKLLRGTYEIKSLHITEPEIRIFRKDSLFNFTELIERFLNADTVVEDVLHLNVLDIIIRNGIVNYDEPDVSGTTDISAINFRSPGMYWNVDSISGDFSFIPVAGKASGKFILKIDSLDYKIRVVLRDFNLSVFNQYIEKYFAKAKLSADLDMDLDLKGNFNKLLQGNGSGRIEIRDFHFGKDSTSDYASFQNFLVSFPEIDLKNNKFYFDSLVINKPFLLYQLFDTLDNFRRLIASDLEEEVEERADTAKMLVEFDEADYYLKTFEVKDGKIEFNDYSINEKFTFIIDSLNIYADSIDKTNRRVKISTEAQIYPSGKITSSLSMDPENAKNFDLNYEVRDVPAAMFNPYIIKNSSFALDRGTVEMHGEWHIYNKNIKSLNHFLVIDPRDTKRLRGRDNKWIPVPLIMAFVRERGGVVDYQIPVEGNLNDPAFNVWDVITDIIKNILVKPPTTPYRLQVRGLEKEVEKNLAVTWQMQQFEIEDNQKKFIKGIAGFLKENPQAKITVQPVYHEEKEKENILFFQAKKKYFLESEGKEVTALSKKDSMEIVKITSRDSLFMKHLENSIKYSELLTLQEKCYRFIGHQIVQDTYDYLVESRREAFLKYFRDNSTEKQVEILDAVSSIPYNWFSYYDIKYKGGIPESLREAYDKLYELNEEPPRQNFNFRRR